MGRGYSATTMGYRNSWGSSDGKWTARGTPPQYMGSAGSPRQGTPHTYDYTGMQTHSQTRGATNQQQQQQMYNNGFYSMDGYNYNRQYYNNNVMCSDGYNNYNYANGMYCGNVYNNNCPEAQQYYDQQQQYTISQAYDQEKTGMVGSPSGGTLPQNGGGTLSQSQGIVPPTGINAYYNCPSGTQCGQDMSGYHDYHANMPMQPEADINFAGFNFFEHGNGGVNGANIGSATGNAATLSSAPNGGIASNITGGGVGGINGGGVSVGVASGGVIVSPNSGGVGDSIITSTVPTTLNRSTCNTTPAGGSCSISSSVVVNATALPNNVNNVNSNAGPNVVHPGANASISPNAPSENSNSSDFNFLSNLANDFAPEYYQLS